MMAPRGTHFSGSGKRKPGTNLRESIYSRINVGARYVVGTVGSRKKYAATAHQGSSPHIIRGRGKMLKFQWERGNLLVQRRGRRGGQFFYFASVRHPGNKRPVRYLTTPLSMVGKRNGFVILGVGRARSRLP